MPKLLDLQEGLQPEGAGGGSQPFREGCGTGLRTAFLHELIGCSFPLPSSHGAPPPAPLYSKTLNLWACMQM